MIIEIKNINDTKKLANLIANNIKGGTSILMSGDLGVGKTTFTQFLCSEVGIDKNVTSPTFAVINIYDVAFNKVKKLYHIDLYRIKSEDELDDIGFEDCFSKDAITVVEWSNLYIDYISELSDKTIFFDMTRDNDLIKVELKSNFGIEVILLDFYNKIGEN